MPYYTDSQPVYDVMCYHAWYRARCVTGRCSEYGSGMRM